MRRGPKPAKPKVEAKPPVARKPLKDDGAKVRDLEKRLAETLGQLQSRDRELAEAREQLTAAHAQLSESHEQQTATSEILRVISQSPTDVQPVFDAIARNAVTLCGGTTALVLRFDGEMLRLAGHHAISPEGVERNRRAFPRRPGRDSPTGRAFLDRSVVHVPDIQAATEFVASTARQGGAGGSLLAVPLFREQEPIGVIGMTRSLVGPFSSQQIALLQTFADQAVIAIENVRLFTELQHKNQALTEAHAQVSESLEQQTATSDILRVISSSPTDTQPVFDTIAANAARLCAARDAQVLRVEGEVLRLVSAYGSPAMPSVRSISRGHAVGRAVIDRQTIHVRDMAQAVAEFPETSALQHGVASILAVPLLRQDVAVGVIRISRTQVQPFTDAEIALLQTFADQAVIAIENLRLFTELQEKNTALTEAHGRVTEALEQQTATAEILRVISESQTEVQPVFEAIADSAMRLFRAWSALVFRYDGELLSLAAARGGLPGSSGSFLERFQAPRRPDDDTIHGRTVITRAVQHIADVEADAYRNHHVRRSASERGFRSVVWVPMLRGNEAVGAIGVSRVQSGGFSDAEIALLQTFADQAVIAIENVRLFKELEVANRELAAASQHKSEFLANMSHELRTPLNAIIGFSEVLGERMFGELNEKQEEYLKDIHASGQHLLSLINDILDLSKIEAGRMELELTDFHLPTALDSALTLVRERAGRRGIAVELNVDERLGQVRADERKVRQVVLNLLSNAIKFTPEGGRIEVLAVPVDGSVEVSVSDTGVGIAPEDQEAVFEEFRQVGTAAKKVEGTGLGLALSRKFVELHGGRIWVTSQVGAGSTFTFRLPVRRVE